MPDLWDPLTYETLMAGTVAHFETQELKPLASNIAIEGPGIYALYYKGKIAAYRPIADARHPIYVGKAVPSGARKGGGGNITAPALRNRLRDHTKSIKEAQNLDPEEFLFRALAIVPVWIVFAEQALIKQYQPVWNTCLEGFGKHDQGRNRAATTQSWWDTLHPGRRWATRGADQRARDRTPSQAKKLVKAYFLEQSGR